MNPLLTYDPLQKMKLHNSTILFFKDKKVLSAPQKKWYLQADNSAYKNGKCLLSG